MSKNSVFQKFVVKILTNIKIIHISHRMRMQMFRMVFITHSPCHQVKNQSHVKSMACFIHTCVHTYIFIYKRSIFELKLVDSISYIKCQIKIVTRKNNEGQEIAIDDGSL